MSIFISGMACLGSFGTGIGALNACKVEPLAAVHADGRAAPADTGLLKEFVPARSLRQTDHFSRMSLLCALLALENAGWRKEQDFADGETGIVLASGYGPATPTFAFLDSILAHGEIMSSPRSFSHSIHNIPAASLAMTLGLMGPCYTLCQLENPVTAGLMTAETWLREERVSRVLFCAVDEHTPLLAAASHHLATTRRQADGKRKEMRARLPVSEAAVCFCLSANKDGSAKGAILKTRQWLETRPPELVCKELSGETTALFVSGAVPPVAETLPEIHNLARAYGNTPVAQALDLALSFARLPGSNPGDKGETACLSLGSGNRLGLVVSTPSGAGLL